MNPLIPSTIIEMTPFVASLVGLAIGCQIVAISYVIRIAKKRFTPTFPYILIAVALMSTTITRIDNFIQILNIEQRTILHTLSSVFLMIAFIKIYSLLKKKI